MQLVEQNGSTDYKRRKVNQTLILLMGLFWGNDLKRIVLFCGYACACLCTFPARCMVAAGCFTTSTQLTVRARTVRVSSASIGSVPWLFARCIPTRSSGGTVGVATREATFACPRSSTSQNVRKIPPWSGLVKIHQHGLGGIVADGDTLREDTILDPEVADINVSRLGSGIQTFVLFTLDRALVVLDAQRSVQQWDSLALWGTHLPRLDSGGNRWHQPTCSASVELLTLRVCLRDLHISPQRLKDTTPPVWLFMYPCTAKRGIDPGSPTSDVVGANGTFEVNRGLDVLMHTFQLGLALLGAPAECTSTQEGNC